ncbi:DNA-directed RNA polymerase III subunit RPC4-like [Uloborus diversus]|uniref:DNA-directed RNA polymerase III subunit RPC4-like n=1 Tax=Uloborus diversus TaxID=327109 RepID=UPI0024094DF2|nr:DNA-directed RNA polymerase III subunit RPC4-like [Uloborus diversus]
MEAGFVREQSNNLPEATSMMIFDFFWENERFKFIDDPDEVEDKLKPVIFPNEIKYEDSLRKKEEIKGDFQKSVKPTFDPDVAKNMGFDVEKVAKFIKKEKGMEEVKETLESFAQLPDEEIFKRLNLSQSELMLLQFPSCVTVPESNVDLDNTPGQRSQLNGETNFSDEQKKISTYLSSLSEGHIGKLQLLKSGKIRLILGALKFDLDSITPLISKHEVVSIRTNTDAGEMVTLGNMEQKIMFDPDVESFF